MQADDPKVVTSPHQKRRRAKVLLMIGSMQGGGSERQTLLLLRHIDRSRFELHLYLGKAEGALLGDVPGDVTIHASTDFEGENKVYWPGRISRQQVDELSHLLVREEIDVVYDRTFHMSMIAGPACHRVQVPRVSTIVSPPDRSVPMLESRFVRIKRKRLARAYRQSDQVITVSNQARNSAVAYYHLSPMSIRVVPNPVDIERLTGSVEKISTRSDVFEAITNGDGISKSNREFIRFVSVGRMTAEKGHAVLLDALAICDVNWPDESPAIELTLVGDGPQRGQLEDSWRHHRCRRHQVRFVGAIDDPAPTIASSSALVLPSLYEGMPNVVLEAMALGTPVIATRAGGTTEIQRDAPMAFWAEPGDARSLATAMLSFVQKPDQVVAHVREASSLIRQYHDVHKTVGLIEDLLDVAASR